MFYKTHGNETGSNFFLNCQTNVASTVFYSIYTIICVLCFLPLSVFILCMGYWKWLNQGGASARKTFMHADIVTYHSAVIQLISVVGAICYTIGTFSKSGVWTMLGVYLCAIGLPSEPLTEMLICVDLYLAVVFPIQYTLHRDKCGVMIRNVCITLVWLCGFGWIGITIKCMPGYATVPLAIVTAIIVGVIVICGGTVVYVLRRSGPGEAGPSKTRVDQKKLRALQIMMCITGVLLLRNLSNVLVITFENSMDSFLFCGLVDLVVLFTIPSSLVLPILYLHKEGKIKFCLKMFYQ